MFCAVLIFSPMLGHGLEEALADMVAAARALREHMDVQGDGLNAAAP